MNASSTKRCLIVLAVCLAFIEASMGACPHADATLTKWSSVTAWNQAGAVVFINPGQNVLLDVSTPLLKSIEINGTLVLDNADRAIDAEWIKVNKGGKLIGGSSDCPIDKKVVITLHGARTTTNVIGTDTDATMFGYKGLVVLIGGTIQLFGKKEGASWARLTSTANAGATTITLDQDISWKAGDRIVIASTDFAGVPNYQSIPETSSLSYLRGIEFPEQTENRTVVSVSGRTVTLDAPLNFMHWGKDDERAEVGLLSRHIVVQGDEASTADRFGGHVMMRHGALVQLSGVEFTRLGQGGILGRYPVHFHNVKEAWGEDMFIVDSSIHHNFQRCLVIHETHGILVKNNVAYDTYGHCYFFEDGAERASTIDNNLGVLARPIGNEESFKIIPTDVDPSIFWITNPNNSFTGNVAVGGRFGFWFILPAAPTGLAATLYSSTDPWIRPRWTPLTKFDRNVAHSCFDTGLEVDNFLKADGTTEEASYSPRIGPFIEGKSEWDYKYAEPLFENFVAYKNRQFGVWGKSSLRFSGLKLMDNRRGFMTNGFTLLENSVIIGETDNVGTPLPKRNHTRSYPDQWGGIPMITGHESYDNGGPQYSKNNVFKNFVSTPTRRAASLSVLNGGPFMLDTRNRFLGLKFENANKIYLNNRVSDAEYGWAVMDLDGSVTGIGGGSWIVSNSSKHMLRNECSYNGDWNAWVCPPFAEGYLQLVLTNMGGLPSNTGSDGTDYGNEVGNGKRTVRATFHALGAPRSDGAEVTGANVGCSLGSRACYQYMHNVVARKGYTIRFVINEWDVATPNDLSVYMDSNSPGDYVVTAIPYPKESTFNIKYRPWSGGDDTICTPATSISTISWNKYYYDVATEHLYVVLVNTNQGYTSRWGFVDYDGSSPWLRIVATCPGGTCTPTKLSIPPMPSFSETPEEIYQADLDTCQLTSTRPDVASGSAFFMFYPKGKPWYTDSRELHYNVVHGLTASVTSVELYKGAYGEPGELVNTKTFPPGAAPVRGVFSLSYDQWMNLAKGNLHVIVKTSESPKGALRGQIRCATSCSSPPPISSADPCKTDAPVISVYSDKALPSPWNDYSWTANDGDVTTTRLFNWTESLCGNSSIKLGIKRGSLSGGIWDKTKFVNVDLSIYKYFEFYVKVLPGFKETALQITFANETSNIGNVKITSKYIQHFVIDETTWTRVRIPLTDLGFVGPVEVVTRFDLQPLDWNTPYKEMLIDEIRFIGQTTESMTTPLNPSEIPMYDANICENNGVPEVIDDDDTEGNSGVSNSVNSVFVYLTAVVLCLIARMF